MIPAGRRSRPKVLLFISFCSLSPMNALVARDGVGGFALCASIPFRSFPLPIPPSRPFKIVPKKRRGAESHPPKTSENFHSALSVALDSAKESRTLRDNSRCASLPLSRFLYSSLSLSPYSFHRLLRPYLLSLRVSFLLSLSLFLSLSL